MKQIKNLLLASLALYVQTCLGQTAQQVLENGIKVSSGQKIFFRYDNNTLKYTVQKEGNDFTTLNDSSIFLVSQDGVNIYLKPLNPLNYSFSTDNKIVIEPVEQNAEAALISILKLLDQASQTQVDAKKAAATRAEDLKQLGKAVVGAHSAALEQVCSGFNQMQQKVAEMQKLLKADQKAELVSIFNLLKKLNFQSEQTTKDSLDILEKTITAVANHFALLESTLTEDIESIETTLSCGTPNTFVLKYIYTAIFDRLTQIEIEQKRRLDNLTSIFKSLRTVQVAASNEKDNRKWSRIVGQG